MQKLFLVAFSLGLLFFADNAQADALYDFNQCINGGKSEAECYRSEARRYVSKIEEIYKKYGQDSYFDGYTVDKTTSNDEKFRKLINMLKLYIQNYCNLINYTKEKQEEDVDPNKCLYDMAASHLDDIEAIESIRESDRF